MSNPVLDVMSYYEDVPNLDNFRKTAYPGKPPGKLDNESLAELPQDNAAFMPYRPTTHEEEVAEEKAKASPRK